MAAAGSTCRSTPFAAAASVKRAIPAPPLNNTRPARPSRVTLSGAEAAVGVGVLVVGGGVAGLVVGGEGVAPATSARALVLNSCMKSTREGMGVKPRGGTYACQDSLSRFTFW